MKPRIVICTRGLVSAALTRLCLKHHLAPLAWTTMTLVDFDAVVRRKERS